MAHNSKKRYELFSPIMLTQSKIEKGKKKEGYKKHEPCTISIDMHTMSIYPFDGSIILLSNFFLCFIYCLLDLHLTGWIK